MKVIKLFYYFCYLYYLFILDILLSELYENFKDKEDAFLYISFSDQKSDRYFTNVMFSFFVIIIALGYYKFKTIRREVTINEIISLKQ